MTTEIVHVLKEGKLAIRYSEGNAGCMEFRFEGAKDGKEYNTRLDWTYRAAMIVKCPPALKSLGFLGPAFANRPKIVLAPKCAKMLTATEFCGYRFTICVYIRPVAAKSSRSSSASDCQLGVSHPMREGQDCIADLAAAQARIAALESEAVKSRELARILSEMATTIQMGGDGYTPIADMSETKANSGCELSNNFYALCIDSLRRPPDLAGHYVQTPFLHDHILRVAASNGALRDLIEARKSELYSTWVLQVGLFLDLILRVYGELRIAPPINYCFASPPKTLLEMFDSRHEEFLSGSDAGERLKLQMVRRILAENGRKD